MSDLPTLLPPSTTSQMDALEIVMAERLIGLDLPIRTLWDVDTCPHHLLDWLAWAFSVDIWLGDWPESTKREVLRQSIAVHRQKGTRASVIRALQAAGYGDAELIERYAWDRYDGTYVHDGAIAHTAPDHWAEYRLRLKRPITIAQAERVRIILETVAPVHCHLKAFDFTQALNVYNAAITHDGTFSHGVA